jgi:probable HAF family extracellular repeat protein
MNRSVSSLFAKLTSLLLLFTACSSWACQTGSTTITNLPATSGAGYQIFAMNPAGQLTGFFDVFQQHPAHAFFYDAGALTDLGTLGGSTSQGFAINTAGQIAGQANLVGDTQFHAVLSSGTTLIDLGTLGGPTSSAAAINSAGVVVGVSDLPGGAGSSAFICMNGVMNGLGNLGSNFSTAFALNNSGVVVGESGVSSGDLHGFLYSGGVLSDLGTLGGTYSSAFAINDAGVVVGESSVNSSDIHGFAYAGGVMTDVGTFGGTYSSAFLVNSNGQVMGIANTLNDSETHGFIYSGGTLTDLGTLGGIYNFPNAINNLGQVVGESLTGTGDYHAFLWDSGKLTDLNTLLPANSGWELVNALYINDAGRIVGIGNLAGQSQWFILDLASPNKAPVAIAGPDQTVDCSAQVTLDGSRSSDPDNDPIVFEWSSGGSVLGTSSILTVSLPLGTNVVTLKVTDPCGASAQTNVTLIVADTTPPNGSCPAAVTASADSTCQAPIPNLTSQVIATDNCTPSQALVITQSPAPGTLVGLGPHTITLTVTDSAGNSSSCGVLFTVADTTPPAIVSTPASFTLSAGSDCQAQVPNVLPNFVANDSCTPANQLVKTQNPPAGTTIGIGSHSILLTVTDSAGNNSTATVAFKVADTTPPTILSGPASMKVSADANCQGAVPNVLSAVLVTDNCTPATQILLTQNPPAGTVLPRGLYSITITASDAAGNSSTLNVPLEIDDTTPPVILSSPAPLTVSANANCLGVVPNVLAGVVATDNCTPASQLVMAQNPAAGTLLPDGQYTIVVTVTDASGNSASVGVPLTIADTSPPVIQSLTANPAVLSPPNHALIPITVSAAVSDNCDAAPITRIISITCNDDTAPGDIRITGAMTATLAATKASSGNIRIYSITVQSTDASGNSSTGVVTVSVPKSNGSSGTTTSSIGTGIGVLGGLNIGSLGNDHDRDRDDRDSDHKRR